MIRHAITQMFIEFFPIFAFFFASQYYTFNASVGVLLVTTIFSMVASLRLFGHIAFMPLVSGVIVIITGFITVFLHHPDAIIVGDSLYYFSFALCIAYGFTQPRHFLERVFDASFAMTKEGWRIVSSHWLIVLILAGAANEIVRIVATPEFWVNYKCTKVILISFFALYQFKIARQYRIPKLTNSWGVRID